MIPKPLITYIETAIIPRYKEFDKAHNLSHVRTVIEESLALARQYEPRSIYGKIVAEADRIIDPDITLRRTVQYGLKQNPAADKEWHYQRFHQHLMAKYAPGGYLKLWFPEGKNAEQLKKLQAIIADEGQLRQVFNRIFEEEK